MANEKIRREAGRRGVKLWQVAYALKMTDSTFSKKLRIELPDNEKARILSVIDEIASNMNGRR